MSNLSWAATVRRVHERAAYLCEYCQTGQRVTGQAMHVEHINPGDDNDLDNLCLSCPSCNLSKAQATSAPDPETGDIVSLFNPRRQVWSEHFVWVQDGTLIQGLTPVGRATVVRLRMNRIRIVEVRKIWVRTGEHPPN
ncbi:MAG: HNH endonuclease [Chloroflexi bacterium]|nr:HNH endonuclease [Chloroflexota bacterium]